MATWIFNPKNGATFQTEDRLQQVADQRRRDALTKQLQKMQVDAAKERNALDERYRRDTMAQQDRQHAAVLEVEKEKLKAIEAAKKEAATASEKADYNRLQRSRIKRAEEVKRRTEVKKLFDAYNAQLDKVGAKPKDPSFGSAWRGALDMVFGSSLADKYRAMTPTERATAMAGELPRIEKALKKYADLIEFDPESGTMTWLGGDPVAEAAKADAIEVEEYRNTHGREPGAFNSPRAGSTDTPAPTAGAVPGQPAAAGDASAAPSTPAQPAGDGTDAPAVVIATPGGGRLNVVGGTPVPNGFANQAFGGGSIGEWLAKLPGASDPSMEVSPNATPGNWSGPMTNEGPVAPKDLPPEFLKAWAELQKQPATMPMQAQIPGIKMGSPANADALKQAILQQVAQSAQPPQSDPRMDALKQILQSRIGLAGGGEQAGFGRAAAGGGISLTGGSPADLIGNLIRSVQARLAPQPQPQPQPAGGLTRERLLQMIQESQGLSFR